MSSSSHYWYSTDSGTDYSAPRNHPTARHFQKRFKAHEMRDYQNLKRWRDPVANELLANDRLEARYQRHLARQRRKKRAEALMFQDNDDRPRRRPRSDTSSGPELSDEPSVLQRIEAAGNVVNWTQAGRIVGGIGGLAVGGFAGEPIGEAIGGAAGLTIGALRNAGTMFAGSTNKNQMARGNKIATAKAVNKSTMSKSGKTATKKLKPVKVSPYLKKAIKQVAAGQQALGYYQRSINGLVGTISTGSGTADGQIPQAVYGGATQTVVYYGNRNQMVDMKTYFAALVQDNYTLPSGTFTPGAATVRPNTDLNFFTPGKIWHAASVLFNGKTENENPYASAADNLKTIFGENDGAITQTTAGFLKVHVKNSKVDFTMKNLSNRTLQVEIYECTPKMKFQDQTPLLESLLVSDQISDGSDNSLIGWWSAGASRTSTNRVLLDGTVDALSIFKNNGWNWNYEKRSMVLQPQEICQHTMDGPSGILDFKKLYKPGSQGASGAYSYATGYKGWSKHVIIAVRPDPVLVASTTTGYSALGIRHYSQRTPNESLNSIISVEAKESYRLVVPEVAGFQMRAVTAGQPQPINYRKPRIQITTVGTAMATTATAIITSREENPAATVDQTSSFFGSV